MLKLHTMKNAALVLFLLLFSPNAYATGLSNSGTALTAFVQQATLQKLTLTGVGTANSSLTLPANAFIVSVLVNNTTANAVTGGIKIGSTNGGVDIYAALAVGANASVATQPTSLLKTYFGTSQQLFIDAVGAWNSASVNITVVYIQL